MHATVVLDLDGTLLETSARHYAVYTLITNSLRIPSLGFSTYWQLRRAGLSNLEVLLRSGLSNEQRTAVEATWFEHIESYEMLKLDRLFSDVLPWLEKWKGMIEFVLVTLRRDASAVKAQLAWLGLERYFRDVVILTHKEGPINVKASALKDRLSGDVLAWVGDSEIDMEAALQLGIHPIGVTSGMRTAEQLLKAGARAIFNLVTEVHEWEQVKTAALEPAAILKSQ